LITHLYIFLYYQPPEAAELLNFGAFLIYRKIWLPSQFYLRRPPGQKRRLIADAILPFLGFGVCFAIWISLPSPAKIVGTIWLLAGVVFLLIKTRGLKEKPVEFDYNDS
jgi:hypothetical protein